jgi:CTP synthase N-terminus
MVSKGLQMCVVA